MEIEVGDRIRDCEDGDCYNEGTVTQVRNGKVLKYILEKIVWNGDEELEHYGYGKEINPEWWYIELIEKGDRSHPIPNYENNN